MKRTASTAALAGLVLSSALTILGPASPASAGVPVAITGRASTLPGSVEPAAKGDAYLPVISGDGRHIAFSTTARLVPADTDAYQDVYVKDLLTDQVERINVTHDGSAPTGGAQAGAITPDGRYVAFQSSASNLVPNDGNGLRDVFVRDRKTGTTTLASVSNAEQPSNGNSPTNHDTTMDLSSDGRYVAFSSVATNLGPDLDATSDIFVRDLLAGSTSLISVSTGGASTDKDSYGPTLSASGRYVAFGSAATNLVDGDTNASIDAFVRDRQTTTTTRVSVHDNEGQSPTGGYLPEIDDAGTKVVFGSTSKLSGIDPNSTADVYVRNTASGTTTVASLGKDGWAAGESDDPAISGDGNTVVFRSALSTIDGIGNSVDHLYSRSMLSNAQARITRDSGNTVAGGDSSNPSLSTDGKAVAFDSFANNLVSNDTGKRDIFFRRPVTFGPHNDTTSFIQHQLWNFGLPAGPGEIGAANAAVRNGASPEHWLVGVANAPAFAGKRPPAIRLYAAYFERLPDKGGLDYWVGKLNSGKKLDQVSAQFAASSEFKTKYGNTTNAQFVALVYGNVLDRAPDAAGLQYWVKKLDQGMSRGTVMTNFSESSEGKRVFQPQVTATLLGLGMLKKIPTGALLTSLLAAGEQSPEQAARVLLDSPEYANTVD